MLKIKIYKLKTRMKVFMNIKINIERLDFHLSISEKYYFKKEKKYKLQLYRNNIITYSRINTILT